MILDRWRASGCTHEIRHHHSGRMCGRTAGRLGGQDAAGGGSAAGHGCGRRGRAGGPCQQRSGASAGRFGRGHDEPVGLRPDGQFHRPGTAGSGRPGNRTGAARLGHSLQSGDHRRPGDARFHGRSHLHGRGRPVAADGAGVVGRQSVGVPPRRQLSEPAALSRPARSHRRSASRRARRRRTT